MQPIMAWQSPKPVHIKIRKLYLITTLAALAVTLALGALVTGPVGLAHAQASTYTSEWITWSILGLDSNQPTVANGPSDFPVGVRVCNTGGTAQTVQTNITGLPSTYITLVNSSTLLSRPIAPGTCAEFYYAVTVDRVAAAFDHRTNISIQVQEVTADGGTPYDPTDDSGLIALSTLQQELYVERLISQNRNATSSISGPSYVLVGNQYTWVVDAKTATNGYENLEHFLTFCPDVYRLDSVDTHYTAPAPFTDDKFWADGCQWDLLNHDNGCQLARPTKYGGDILYEYHVTIIGAGTCTLRDLVYDFSGSSFHYNGDYPDVSLTVVAVEPVCVNGRVYIDVLDDDMYTNSTDDTPVTSPYTIYAYQNVNGNDTYDAGVDPQVATATPDADGLYEICMPGGSGYFIQGVDGSPNQVSGLILEAPSSNPAPVNPDGSGIPQSLGGDVNDFDFRYGVPLVAGTGAITGTLFEDDGGTTGIAGNDIHDGDEDDLGSGETVVCYLDDGDGIYEPFDLTGAATLEAGEDASCDPGNPGTVTSDTTDTNGDYLFDLSGAGLPPGDYWIDSDDSPGGGLQIGSTDPALVTIPFAGGTQTQDFAYDGNVGVIEGTVFTDDGAGGGTSGDNLQNGIEDGVQTVTITLWQDDGDASFDPCGTPPPTCDTQISQMVTDINGFYSFSNLPNTVDYWVQIETSTLAAGLSLPLSEESIAVTSVPPGNPQTVNFALDYDGVISGNVYRDDDSSGLKNGAEPNLQNIDVTLYQDNNGNGILDAGDTVYASVPTDVNGDYSFNNLPPGNYLVDVPDDTVADADVPANHSSPTPDPAAINLTAGGSGTADFGYLPPPIISGTVYRDEDSNNTLNAGDVILSGVTVYLYADASNDGIPDAGELLATTVTDINGEYVFDASDGLVPGRFLVVVDTGAPVPATHTLDAATANPYDITLASGDVSAGNDFRFDPPAVNNAIGGIVYDDLNGNGVQDPGEPGIDGVTVELRNAFNAVIGTAVTAGGGLYSFTGLVDGSYTVVETDPTGYSSTTPNTVNASVSGGATATVNFGDKIQPGVITGLVFNDNLTTNGSLDAGEPGIGGVTVRLFRDNDGSGDYSAGDLLVSTTTTNAAGGYAFYNLAPDDYVVVETDLSGYYSTSPNELPAIVNAGQTTANVNFADLFPPPVGSIVGTVWNDTNSNGIMDPGEQGLPGVAVELYDSTGTVLQDTVLTDAGGNYVFTSVPVADYVVRETDPSGYGTVAPNTNQQNVTVPAGSSTTANFGDLALPGTISGSVEDTSTNPLGGVTITLYHDTNGNGVLDPGVDIIATTTVTAGDGTYSFSGVPPGAYIVVETDPAGYVSTGAGTTPNAFAVNLPAGGSEIADFVDAPVVTGSISGTVWNDINGNGGSPEGGEPGIAGVTIELWNSDGTVLLDTTVTDAGGIYEFSGLPTGVNYQVVENDPTGYTSTTPNLVAVAPLPVVGGTAVVNFGDQADPGAISGTVWNDANSDGVIGFGEVPLPGVTITLYSDVNGNGQYDPGTDTLAPTGSLITPSPTDPSVCDLGTPGANPVTTDSSGGYSFPCNAPGSYLIVETDPAGYASTTANVRNVIIAPGNSQIFNFGDTNTPPAGTLFGVVWNDANGSTTQDPGEGALSGVTLSLTDGVTTYNTVTDASGGFNFTGLPNGTYTLTENTPGGYVSTTGNVATPIIIQGNSAYVEFGDMLGTLPPPPGGGGRGGGTGPAIVSLDPADPTTGPLVLLPPTGLRSAPVRLAGPIALAGVGLALIVAAVLYRNTYGRRQQ